MNKKLRALLYVTGLLLGVTLKLSAQAPVAGFSASATTSCAPAAITFTDLSTNTPTSWTWNLGNSTIATNQNPTTVYTTPGTYTVTLTATNASGSNTKTSVNYITIVPAPTVDFTAVDTSISCLPKTVAFTFTGTAGSPGTAVYAWDFGDGSFSTAANPAHTYTVAGTYNISLIVTNGGGCTNSLNKSQYIRVAPKPTAGFSAVNNNTCSAPTTTTFSNTSSGAVSYEWLFGDGGTSAAANPVHTYTAPGSYTVTLIATNSNGCKDTIVKPAYANIGTLAVGFTTSTTTTCTNAPVTFTNTTTPAGGTVRWYFGDGDTSSLPNPVHRYSSAGTYTAKLVVKLSGCSDSVTHTVSVTQGANVQFAAANPNGCTLPHTVSFTNSTTGAVSYIWLFGDGSTSTLATPSHTYTSNGQFTVRLIAISSNGCQDTLTRTNYVQVFPVTGSIGSVLNYPGCAPAAIYPTANVNSTVPITGINWNFGDGATDTGIAPVHVYTAGGSYTVVMTVTTSAGCSFSFNVPVFVGTHSTPSYTATPTTVCLGQGVVFTNTTTGSSGSTTYRWIMGDGGSTAATNPVYYYTNVGVFTPILISNNNGCTDSFRIPGYITVNPPLAEFTATVSCTNHRIVSFANSSIGATTWSWDFGDGSPLFTGANPPPHTYAANGNYNVSLTVTNGSVCTHTRIIPVAIFNLAAAFTAAPATVCAGTPITFTATTDTNYVKYIWRFGDGLTDSSATGTISHLYATTGALSPRLIVRDRYGCQDSVTKAGYINVNGIVPAFSVSSTQTCSPVTITFTDLSVSTLPNPVRTWNFGDGTTTTVTTAVTTHTYTTPGVYTITLNLTDASGCTAVLVKTGHITVNRPVASFTASSQDICLGTGISFTNSSTGVGPLSYNWNFGDGTPATTLVNPTHLYAANGTYSARLITTDGTGCKDTLIRMISVSSVSARFTMSDSVGNCPPFSVRFTSTGTGAGNYLWDFGNGGTSNSANPSNTYTMAGLYTVKLIVTNATGCRDSFSKTVRVYPSATGTLSYGPLDGCSPLTVRFTATSTGSSSTTFDFNNGYTQTSATGSVTYTYTTPGVFVPVIILSSGPGCNTSVIGSDSIHVNRVYAGFTTSAAAVCLGTAINFTDTSYAIGGTSTTRNWSFGDGATATGITAAHTYAAAGTYTVRIITGTAAGCRDTALRTVVVNPYPVIAAASQNICSGGSVTLTATGATTYSWSPATSLSCSTCPNPVASPATTTTYTINGTTAGCTSTGTVTVTVNPLPSTLSAGPNQSICAGASATLNATGAGSYTWTASPTLSCTSCASPTATPTTTTTYTVTGTSAAGCTGTASITVTVNPRPTIAAAGKAHCTGSSDTLSATGGVSYVWSPATGLSCTACPNPIATPTATTTYTVTGTDANGCTNTATSVVTVRPLPTITATGSTNICTGGSTILTAAGGTTYSWTPATGLSCTNCASPTAAPTATTTYTVTGTNANGCTNTATITVTVNPLPSTLSAGPNQSICAGASATLNATGAGSYTWTASPTLSCTSCASPTATPTTTTTYTVTGTSAAGCTGTASVTVTVNPRPTIAAASKAHCTGSSDTLSATGGISYVWSPATGLSCTACPNPIATPTATTTYTVTGTDVNGCTNTATSVVTIHPLPTITATGSTNICTGGSTILTAAGGTSYSWTPTTGLSCTNCASPTAAPTTTTTYTVTGTNVNGCSNTATITVTVNPLPSTLSAGPNQSICAGASATLNATGAGSYTWTASPTLSCTSCASPTATPTTTTTYTVTGTSAAGCTGTASITVTVNPRPAIAAASKAHCTGSSDTLSATGGVSYVWSPATGLSCTACPNPIATPTATTTYTVTGTDANGCTNTATAVVTIQPLPTITATGSTNICTGGSTILTAAGGTVYSWTPATGLSCTNCASPTAAPTATTTYTVTGTNANGCTNTATITVTVNPLPSTLSAGPNQSICAGASATLNATGAGSYTWTASPTLSCTSCASPTATPTTTTTYTVTGTSAAGCTGTASVTVTVNPRPMIAAASKAHCTGSSDTLSATGGVSYVWSPATGLSCTACPNPIATPTATTTYTVTGTDANGCINTATAVVTVRPLPTITATGSTNICTGGSTILTAAGGTTYSWTPATGLSCTTCASPTAAPTATTTYTVTGTNANGCTNTATITVTVNPLPSTLSAGPNQSICAGASATLNATGAGSYTWTASPTLSCTSCASPTATPTTTTTYTVTGTSAAGCTGTASVTVTVNPRPAIAAASKAHCTGSSDTLSATGGVSYVWSPATGLSCTACPNPIATPAATTTYTVTGTDANGCTNTATAVVTVRPLPTITATGSTNICTGGSTVLTAAGGTTYSWTPVTGLSCTTCASPTAAPTATTTYTVTGTNANGCTNTATITVTVNPLPSTLSAGPNQTICNGSSTLLNATGATTYTWTASPTLSCTSCASPTATPTTTTTYTVTGTSTAGCTGTASVIVTVNPRPAITTVSKAHCTGSSDTLSATGAVSYVWSPATGLSCTACPNPVATPAATTTYTVTGTDANGCTNTATAMVTINPIPVLTVSGNNNICLGSSTTLTASGAATYNWTPATGLSCTGCASPAASPTVNTTYTVTGTSTSGCTGTTTVTVTVNPLPVITTSAPPASCPGIPVTLAASGAASYIWSPATGLSCTNCSSPAATPATTTTYTVTGTDAAGCKGTGTVTVTIKPVPVLSVTPDTSICKLSAVQLNASGADTYLWTPATALSCTTCANPVASPAGTTTYTVTGTGSNGCIASGRVTVSMRVQPLVNAGPDQTICAGKSARLQASGANSYIWSPAPTLTCVNCPDPEAAPPVSMTYNVTGTDIFGCVDSDKVDIIVIQRGPISAGKEAEMCEGQSVRLVATGGTAYSWTPAASLNNASIPNPTASPLSTTGYQVIIHQGQCFTDTLSTMVTVHPTPAVDAGPDRKVMAGTGTTLQTTVNNVKTYSWSPADGLSCTNCSAPVATPLKTTTYTVNVSSEFGCTAQDEITLSVVCDGSQIWLPNTFTPNGDGQNDRFYPHGKGITTVKRLRIYDRWGEVLYDVSNIPTDDVNYGWDGTYKNKQLKPDVYVYILSAECSTGEPLEIKGDISLIR